MKTKIFKILLLILWMILIFILSNQTGSESTNLSDGVIGKIICPFTDNCNLEIYTIIIRKTAHFMLYFILGVLSYINFKINKENMLYAFLICVIYAFTDEIHQMVISNRSGEVRDIIIDSLGALSSILLVFKLKKRD